MSHLPTLSDYTKPVSKSRSQISMDTNDEGGLTNNQDLAKILAGMSRKLSTSGTRIARNRKLVKRSLHKYVTEMTEAEDSIDDKDWGKFSVDGSQESKDDTGWDTDLEIEEVFEGFDHSGRTAYIDTCHKHGVIPVSYYLRHMHDSELTLRHHQLGSTAVKPIAISLVSNAKILSLDLTDNSLGLEGAQVLCDMLRENCFITHLNLSENHLGSESAELLSDIMILTTTITHMTLSNNQFDDRAAVNFAEAIMSTSKIEYLNLSHNQFAELSGMVLGPAIAENSTIKELDLSWNSLRRKGATAIAHGIKQNIMIKKLNLSWNGFGVEGVRELGKALIENTTLQEIDITNNRITTEGAVLFGKGVAASESVHTVRIGKNPMQSAGCWAICSAVLKNPNMVMRELDFEDILVNKDFYDILQDVKNLIPDIKVNYGGLEIKKPKAITHPIIKLQNYITRENLRLIDFFQKFDADGSMSVSHQEFRQGIMELGINLSDGEMDTLIHELDKDGDGEINYSELVIGNQEFKDEAKKKQARVTIQAFSPTQSSSVLRS